MADTVGKKRILVTGGAGFIGSNLCRRLLQNGHQVFCLDNFFSSSRDNIKNLENEPNFTFIEQSVTEPIDLDVDEIYHLACPASPVYFQKQPLDIIHTCVDGAFQVLELARKRNVRVLFTSTSEVYGDPLEHPQTENYRGNVNQTGVRACYDEGKRIGETIFYSYYRQYGTDIRIVRIFNTYGPNMMSSDGRVVSNFIMQALRGEDLTLYGDGSQTRSFCYVDDTVNALISVMGSDQFYGPINIGNPNEITVKELSDLVLKLIESPSKVINCDLPQDDPVRRKPDISKAKELLNWQPEIPLEEGLEQTIQYFRNLC